MAVVRFRFFVEGKPVQQGSKTGFVVTNKASGKSRAVVTDANATDLKPFRVKVREAARAAYAGPQLVGALVVVIDFMFERGKTVTREFMTTKPDLDKLVRSIGDALTDSKTILDDAQIVKLHLTKSYGEAGVMVTVGELREGEKI